MATEAVPNAPVGAPPRKPPLPGSVNIVVATWTRAFFSRPSQVAAALELTGALGIASVLPFRRWPLAMLATLIAAIGVALVVACVRITIGARLPRWCLHVDAGIGTLVVTAVAAASGKEHLDLANLYLLVVLFTVLYLPLRAALAHFLAAGGAYVAVLGFGPTTEDRLLSWLAVFGTAAVLGGVVLGLVSVLRVMAREDPLTGLANRRLWDERLDDELERARRSSQSLSVVIVDLDGFKTVNDVAGHDVGDKVLREVAKAWKIVVRGGGDFLARLGGDEFGLLAPGSGETGVRRLAERLADALPDGIGASIGVATWDGAESASDLQRRADRSMYEVKARRRHSEWLRRA